MRAIAADLKSGQVGIFDVPSPELRAGGVLVRTAFSAISSGTERNTIETGKKSILGKALARPDLVRQVLDFAKTNGMSAAYKKTRARLDAFTSLGYSCSGTVIAVGDGVTEFMPGDRVACAGVGYACHSEINFIPMNLTAHIPDGVALDAASLTTIGAIAVQGLRQSGVSFGETVVVIGTGLVGVLTIQLARAAGCRVIAIDRDPTRVANAVNFGAQLALPADDESLGLRVEDFSRYGADAAIVAAASTSAEPVEMAARLLRDRGRIVVLGAVPLGISREIMYRKELSLAMSRSYGPGRYDPNYEELGHDYPIGYVRWTEKRNMEAFLGLLAAGTVSVNPLLRLRHDIEHGADAYDEIVRSGSYTAIISYGSAPAPLTLPLSRPSRRALDELHVGCIGTGNFARSVIFPVLRQIQGVRLTAVASATGVSAVASQRSFGFQRALQTTELLSSPDVDAAFVLSRHDSHARYVLAALSQKKTVLVEKPLAITREELASICTLYQERAAREESPFLMVGFNRRFSEATAQVRKFFEGRREPMLVHIRVNAGHLGKEHWSQSDANGGRLIGECCHFVDWARALVGESIRTVYATAIPDGVRYNRDNISLVISFADGSLANILYLANGDRSLSKEFYEVFCEGAVARIHDFRSVEFCRAGKRKHLKLDGDKGHKQELELTVRAMREHRAAPIPFTELAEVTEAMFAAGDSIQFGMPVEVKMLELFAPASPAVPLSTAHSD